MIRVLQVIGAMDRGGAETFIMNVYRKIDRTQVQFDFLVHTERECDYDDEITQLGGIIYRLPRFTGLNFFEYKKACNDHFRNHPEHKIVHGHIGSTAGIYLSQAKKHGAFTIAHSHSQDYDRGMALAAFKFLTHSTRNIADFFFGCSPEAGLDRFGKKIVEGSRYALLRNGVDVNRFSFDEGKRAAFRAAYGIEEELAICHIGRLTEVKNHSFLFDVFKEIKARDSSAILLLAGRGELEHQLRSRASQLGLSDSIRFLGVIQDTPSLLCGSDCFIFPSISEGLPVSTIEAQASGIPCLLSDGIPTNAVVCSKTERLSLSLDAKLWASKALEMIAASNSRTAASNEVRNAGFDSADTAIELQQFYLERSSYSARQ